ncbi:DUF4331 family protein [Actinocorallia lasiicapitis]
MFVVSLNSNINGMYQKGGFHPEARYEFKVHFDGAEFEGLTYRISFGEPDKDGAQALRLEALTGVDAREDGADGVLILEGRTGQTATAGDIRLWTGRVKDPFYTDPVLTPRVAMAIAKGTAVDLSGWDPANAKDAFAGKSVDAIVLEIPDDDALLGGEGTDISVWCATKLATDAGGWRQINRGGHPMMWPLFWPTDTDFTDPADTRHPSQDLPEDGDHLAAHVAAVVKATGSVVDPDGYGQLVAHQLYPDVLPYVVGTEASYGFAAFNGRSLADNVAEPMICLITGTAIPLGLSPATNEDLRTTQFPYMVPA